MIRCVSIIALSFKVFKVNYFHLILYFRVLLTPKMLLYEDKDYRYAFKQISLSYL